MSDINVEIMEMLDQDYSIKAVASILNIPVDWVFNAIEVCELACA